MANSWLNYFVDLDDNEGNKNLKAFQLATDSSGDFNSKILNLMGEDVNAIILSASHSFPKVKIYHSAQNLGGTRSKPDNKMVALDGVGCNATPVVFSIDSLKTKVNFKTPSLTTLKSLTDADSVNSTSAPINGDEFNHASFVILPPFIAKAILSSST